jgi:hypothetical protein
MTEQKSDLLKRAEAALTGLSIREPNWDELASRIEGAATGTGSDEPALFDAPLPQSADDGESLLITAPADDSVPVPHAATTAPRESNPPLAATAAEARRETVSLAELARASIAKRGHAEKASIAKETLAVASQSRAEGERIAQRVQAASQARAASPHVAPQSAPPPPPSARRAASTRPGDVLKGPWPGVVIGGVALAAAFALFFNRPEAPAPVTIVQSAPQAPAAPRTDAPR